MAFAFADIHRRHGFVERDTMKCEICKREAKLHEHHLIPRKYIKKLKGNRRINDSVLPKANICTDCEKMIHSLFKLKELRDDMNSVDKLLKNKEINNYVRWIKDKQIGVVKHPRRTWQGGKYD